MKTNFASSKNILLTCLMMVSFTAVSFAASFVASLSGSWSGSSNWTGSQPGFFIGSADNVVIPVGITLSLDSDLTIEGNLILNGGTLNLNGKNLTVDGAIITTESGVLMGNKTSDVSFNGFGGAGKMFFKPGYQLVNNLIINIGSNNGIYLGSGLTVGGTLVLTKGTLAIGDSNLIVTGKSVVQSTVSLGYVMNIGSGSLVATVFNTGIPYTFPVGTQTGYAPLKVTNNSATAGIFSVNASEGVLADGNSGISLSETQNMVSTSWNISSTIQNNVNVNLNIFWTTDMQVNNFDNSQAYVSQYSTGGWSINPASAASLDSNGSYSMEIAAITTLGRVAVFGKNTATAINTIPSNTAFGLYPNPATSSIALSLGTTSNYPLMKIYDMAGKEVMTQQIENDVTALNINNLGTGTYLVSLDGKPAQKFIKE